MCCSLLCFPPKRDPQTSAYHESGRGGWIVSGTPRKPGVSTTIGCAAFKPLTAPVDGAATPLAAAAEAAVEAEAEVETEAAGAGAAAEAGAAAAAEAAAEGGARNGSQLAFRRANNASRFKVMAVHHAESERDQRKIGKNNKVPERRKVMGRGRRSVSTNAVHSSSLDSRFWRCNRGQTRR
jgi:hypothetical protein